MEARSPCSRPSGTLTDWDKILQLEWPAGRHLVPAGSADSAGTQVFRKWYTAPRRAARAARPARSHRQSLNLANGDYKWRMHGLRRLWLWHELGLQELHAQPGLLHADHERQPGRERHGECQRPELYGRLHGRYGGAGDCRAQRRLRLLQLERGCKRHNQPGLGDDGREQECDSQLHSFARPRWHPTGTLTSWDKIFSWTGLADATWYLLEVQTSGGTQVFRKWYTSAQTDCSGGTACSVTAGRPEPGERGLQVARHGLRRLWLWNQLGLQELHARTGLLQPDDERQPGWEWDGECTSPRPARVATRPARWCS